MKKTLEPANEYWVTHGETGAEAPHVGTGSITTRTGGARMYQSHGIGFAAPTTQPRKVKKP